MHSEKLKVFRLAPIRGMIALLCLFTFCGVAAARSGAPAPTPAVTLALQWQPQSQFAGYYLARNLGFYRDAGLEVELVHGDSQTSSMEMLVTGSSEFATAFLSDGLLASPEVVQVMQLGQRSNLMLIAWRDMGIQQPADLHGRPISYWQGSFSQSFEAFFAKHGIQPEPIPQFSTISLFLQRGVAACSAMEYNELNRLWQAGIDPERLTTFVMRDFDLGFPEDGLYTTARHARQHPRQLESLRAATRAGWEHARKHPEQALDAVLEEAVKAGISTNRSHQRWMLEHILASIFLPETPETVPGRLDIESFSATAKALVKSGQLSAVPDFEQFAPLERQLP